MTADRAVARVLVTGAAGLLGRAVLAALAAHTVPVTALVLHDPGDLAADRVVVGDATDPDIVRPAVAGAEAVIHLAALASPEYADAEKVFSVNTRATFTVLEQAGRAGVRRAVIASSLAVLGLVFAPQQLHPLYVPVDEAHPVQITDPYALSKLVDEATGEMMARRYGMRIVALRFPFLGGQQRLQREAADYAADPALGAGSLWAYLDVRDAARACLLGLDVAGTGCSQLFVAAPNTLAPYPTQELLAAYHPAAIRRAAFDSRQVPVDLSAAQTLLRFTAAHEFVVDPLPLATAEARVGSVPLTASEREPLPS